MKSFSILGGKAHVIELPEGATNLQVVTIHQGSKSFPSLKYDRPDLVRGYIDLPPGTWQIVGRLSEVTADDVSDLTGHYYNKYNERYVEFACSATRVTPIDDLESAILAEGWHLDKNPFGKAPGCGCTGPSDKGACDGCDEYMEAQSRVLDRERTLILRRVDQSD